MKIELEIQPWITPNHVIVKLPPRPKQEGLRESPTIPLSELDPEILSEMCDLFRQEIFTKAGKTDPRL